MDCYAITEGDMHNALGLVILHFLPKCCVYVNSQTNPTKRDHIGTFFVQDDDLWT